MKLKTKLMMESLWYKARIDDPFQVIQDAFDTSDLAAFKKFIFNLYSGACQKAPNSGYSYADIVHYLELTESLLNTAYLLDQGKRSWTYVPYDFNWSSPEQFCGRRKYIEVWDYLPKALSIGEYINPYAAFRKAFQYRSVNAWKQHLKLLATFAFDTGSIFEGDVEVDVLNDHLHLMGLIEAAHLVDVRLGYSKGNDILGQGNRHA